MSEERTDVEKQVITRSKKTMTNTSFHTRRWDALARLEDKKDDDGIVVASAGSTLELEPGESALVLVADDFEDPWLKEAKVGASKKGTTKQETSTTGQKEG